MSCEQLNLKSILVLGFLGGSLVETMVLTVNTIIFFFFLYLTKFRLQGFFLKVILDISSHFVRQNFNFKVEYQLYHLKIL